MHSYGYSALNEIISKITSAKSKNKIKKESTGVLLQKYEAFESIAHVLSSGSYLYSQNHNAAYTNGNVSAYQPGEMVLSNITFENSGMLPCLILNNMYWKIMEQFLALHSIMKEGQAIQVQIKKILKTNVKRH